MSHAVQIVGYNNEAEWWLAKNSWGSGFADGGFFRIGFGVAGVCGEAYGLAFSLYNPRGLPLDRITASSSRPGCYDYRASSFDYVSEIANRFKITPQKVLLDNVNVITSPDMFLGGITIAICGIGTIPGRPLITVSKPLITVSPGLGQVDALMKIKEGMVAPYPPSFSGWTRASGGNGGYCNWKGVTCDGSKDVIGVRLDYDCWYDSRVRLPSWCVHQGKRSMLPSVDALRALPKLKVLDLQRTWLSGTLPPEYGSLSWLEALYLGNGDSMIIVGGNKLSGTLPAAWSGMVAMKDLNLSTNRLSGPLPASWGSLANMEKLYLQKNELSGPLPASWGSLARLEVLHLCCNKLSGTLPAAWSNMKALEDFRPAKNQLSGPLPASWGSMARLELLHISNNMLSGTLPAAWGSLAKIEELYLMGNMLSGSVPTAWKAMTRLTEITLQNNPNLVGCLPANWKGHVKILFSEEGFGPRSSIFGDLGWGEFQNTEITGFCK